MASSKIVLFQGMKKADGTKYISLRLTFNRKHTFISIASIKPDQWDPEKNLVSNTHPNHKTINSAIKAKDHQAYDLMIEYEKGTPGLTKEKIIKILRGKRAAVTFYDFFCEYVEEHKEAKKYNQAASIESIGRNIWRFINKRDFPIKSTKESKFGPDSIFRLDAGHDIALDELSAAWLRKLKTHLEQEREQSERSIFNHMNVIRTVFNRAKTAKAILGDDYPFDDYSMTMPESQKIPLNKEEIKRLEAVQLESPSDTWIDAKNAWLFSYSFGGMRISDALSTRLEDFIDGKLHYVMGKNNKPVSIPIPKRAQKIIDYYTKFKDRNQGFLFPALRDANLKDIVDVKRKLNNAIRLYGKWLVKLAKAAKIPKKINPHNARHSFGEAAGDSIPIRLLQFIYRHRDIKTTINYQQHWMNQKQLEQSIMAVVDF